MAPLTVYKQNRSARESNHNRILENVVYALSFRSLFFKASECELIFKYRYLKTSLHISNNA